MQRSSFAGIFLVFREVVVVFVFEKVDSWFGCVLSRWEEILVGMVDLGL
jgi:hypothetical protein